MRKGTSFLRLVCLGLILCMLAGTFGGCAEEQTVETTQPSQPQQEPLRHQISADSGVISELSPGQRLVSQVTRAPGETQTKEYTLMVYMVGSDLESRYGCASSDILEMLDSGLDPSRCNLVVYTGGSKSWDLDVPADRNCVWTMTADGTSLEVAASTSQPSSMGDPGTFLDFMSYAYNNFPAEHYGLICWDHGGGPLYGYGSDELFDHDGLSLSEMQAAMAESPFAGEKLAFMGFDACLMASLEVADLFADYAGYLIASEETEPGSGWDYSFLAALNTTSDTQTLARSILSAYEASMKANIWKPEYTLSCMDLSKVEALNDHMEVLYDALVAALEGGGFTRIAKSRNECKRFGMGAVADMSSSLDLVDLGDLLGRLDGTHAEAARAALDSLEALVVDQVTNVEGASGVSLYFPYDNKSLFQQGGNSLYDVQLDYANYKRFVSEFTYRWLNGDAAVSLNKAQTVELEDDCLTFALTAEQLESLGSVTYTVLKYDPELDTYTPLLMDIPVEPDENGVVSIPRDPVVFFMHTDLDDIAGTEGVIWPARAVGQNTYISVENRLLTSGELLVGERETIQIALSHEPSSGEVEIQSVLSLSDDAVFFGKQDVDISLYGCIAYYWEPLYVTYDADGELLPWSQWTDNGWDMFTYKDYATDFYMTSGTLQEFEGIYYAQMILTDAYGNTIGTRMAELRSNIPYEVVEQALPEGTMRFHVYEDHALVADFAAIPGESTFEYQNYDLTIPGTVNGVPVTIIGTEAFDGCLELRSVVIPDTVEEIWGSAFRSCWNLEAVSLPEGLRLVGDKAFDWSDIRELTLPDGLEYIGPQAFSGIEAVEITIPDSVRYIGAGAFQGSETLTAFHADGDSYRSVDGVLFTADGKTLVSFPGAKTDRYTVPDGVETIADMAFRGNQMLTSITFPEGLREISQLAFCDVKSLTGLELPDSLEIIGNGAFCASLGYDLQENINTIHIGPNVTWIGQEAFSACPMLAFQVDPDNDCYSSVNGCLLNKSGTRLIQVPYRHTGKLEVPEGVSYIDTWSMYDCNGITELVLPDSVVSIAWGAGVSESLQKLTVGSGMTDWQNIHAYSAVPEIVISEDNPNFTIHEGSVYSRDMTILYLARPQAETFRIPEGVTAIAYGALGNCPGVKVLQLPATVTDIQVNNICLMEALETIEVAAGNPRFAACDGLLYSADGDTLSAVPLGRTGTIRVREGTKVVGAYAFYSGYDLKADTIIIPESVTTIREGNFVSSPFGQRQDLYLPASLVDIYPDMLEYVRPDLFTIHAPKDSPAAIFAEDKGITVIYE